MIHGLLCIFVGVYALAITWKYTNLDERWIRICHILGVPSRKTPPDEVFDKLATVVAQSKILDIYMYEEIDEDDVEFDSTVQE